MNNVETHGRASLFFNNNDINRNIENYYLQTSIKIYYF